MSLEQNNKKIKPLIQLLIAMQVIVVIYLYGYIYYVYNRGDDIQFIFGHFETSFLGQGLVKLEPLGSDGEKNFYITASINGARYYYAHCAGVGRINLENRISFESEIDAEKAGYTLAKNCKK